MNPLLQSDEIKLNHIGLQSPNPQRLANFYQDVLAMTAHSQGNNEWLCEGSDRTILISMGKRNEFEFAAFSSTNFDKISSLKERVKSFGFNANDYHSTLLKPGAFYVIDPDKRKICFGTPIARLTSEKGLHGPLQHVTFRSKCVESFEKFYNEILNFKVVDQVVNTSGKITASFLTSNQEHHTIACFKASETSLDHHSYEVGKWNLIRDWCDFFSKKGVRVLWGPGRHGPGNNLFVFIEDLDGNRIELSAELESPMNRQKKVWPHEEKTLNLWGKAIMRI